MRVVLAATIGAAVAILAVVATDDSRVGALAMACIAYLAVASKNATARGLIGGACLIIIPPGFIGEASAIATLAAIVVLGLVVFSFPPAQFTATSLRIVAGLTFSGLALTMLALVPAPQIAVSYLAAGVVVLAAVQRPDFVTSVAKGLAWLLAPLAASYLMTIAAGFGSMSTFQVGGRSVEWHAPLTLATSGPPFLPETRRMILMVGEPGLAVFYLLFLSAVLLASAARFRGKVWGLIAITATAVFGQSWAALLAIGFGLIAYLIGWVATSRGRRLVALILSVGAVAALVPLAQSALTSKAELAAESVTDRGILNAGQASTASLGNINIIVGLSNNPQLAIALIAMLGLLLLVTRSLAGLFAWGTFAITAIVAQPVQWQVGGWVMVLMAIAFAASRRVIDTAERTRDLSNRTAGIDVSVASLSRAAGRTKLPILPSQS